MTFTFVSDLALTAKLNDAKWWHINTLNYTSCIPVWTKSILFCRFSLLFSKWLSNYGCQCFLECTTESLLTSARDDYIIQTLQKKKSWLNVDSEGLLRQVSSLCKMISHRADMEWNQAAGSQSWHAQWMKLLFIWLKRAKPTDTVFRYKSLFLPLTTITSSSTTNCCHHCLHFCSPCVWRQRRPVRRPCTAVRRSLSWWGGRWSTQRWGRSGRAPPLLRTPAAAPAPCPCPSPRSAAHSMTPTWTTPPPAERTHRNTHTKSLETQNTYGY